MQEEKNYGDLMRIILTTDLGKGITKCMNNNNNYI